MFVCSYVYAASVDAQGMPTHRACLHTGHAYTQMCMPPLSGIQPMRYLQQPCHPYAPKVRARVRARVSKG